MKQGNHEKGLMSKTSRHSRLSRRKVLIFSILTAIFFFGLLELAVRIAFAPVSQLELTVEPPGQVVDRDVSIFESDPVLFWKLKPDLNSEWWDYTVVSTNSAGFRYPHNFTKKKQDNTIRIVCLGDSITFGYRVPFQSTFPLIVERALQEAFPEKKFEVIPLAVPGYTSFQGYLLFRSLGVSLKPDLVIISFAWNDTSKENCSDSEAFERYAPLRGLKRVLRSSQLYLHLCKWAAGWRKRDLSKTKQEVARVSIKEYVRNFREITKLAKRAGATVIWLAPMVQEINPKTRDIPAYRQALAAAAQKDSIPFLKVPLLTEKMSSQNIGFFGEPLHPNDRGHYILAREMLSLLLDPKSLPLPESRISSVRKQYEKYYSPPKETTSIPKDEAMLQPGLLGRLYSGITAQGEILCASADAPINFSWSNDLAKPLVSPFCIQWDGFLKIAEDNDYEFATCSDDGSQLWIDNRIVLTNSGQHGPMVETGNIQLKKGLHPIELRYYDYGYGATISLLWSQDEKPLEVIPAHVLFH